MEVRSTKLSGIRGRRSFQSRDAPDRSWRRNGQKNAVHVPGTNVNSLTSRTSDLSGHTEHIQVISARRHTGDLEAAVRAKVGLAAVEHHHLVFARGQTDHASLVSGTRRKTVHTSPDVICLDALHTNIGAGCILPDADVDRGRTGKRSGTGIVRPYCANVRLAGAGGHLGGIIVKLREKVVLTGRKIRNTVFAKIINLAAIARTVAKFASHPHGSKHLNHAA